MSKANIPIDIYVFWYPGRQSAEETQFRCCFSNNGLTVDR